MTRLTCREHAHPLTAGILRLSGWSSDDSAIHMAPGFHAMSSRPINTAFEIRCIWAQRRAPGFTTVHQGSAVLIHSSQGPAIRSRPVLPATSTGWCSARPSSGLLPSDKEDADAQ